MLSFVFMRAHTVYIYIPLHLHSRSFIPNVHTLFCPLAHLALRQVHLCSAMGGTNACNMVLTLAVLLMSRQVFVHLYSFILFFFIFNWRAHHFLCKKGEQNHNHFLQEIAHPYCTDLSENIDKNNVYNDGNKCNASTVHLINWLEISNSTYFNPPIYKCHLTFSMCACCIS